MKYLNKRLQILPYFWNMKTRRYSLVFVLQKFGNFEAFC